MRNAGIGSWPERRLRISPHKPALWFEGTTATHGEFALDVRRAATVLADLGVRKGDRVAWFGANHPAALHTLYACGQLGAVWVPVNARLSPAEARYVLEHSGTTLVVHGAEHVGRRRRCAPSCRRSAPGCPPSRRRGPTTGRPASRRPSRWPATSRSRTRTPA